MKMLVIWIFLLLSTATSYSSYSARKIDISASNFLTNKIYGFEDSLLILQLREATNNILFLKSTNQGLSWDSLNSLNDYIKNDYLIKLFTYYQLYLYDSQTYILTYSTYQDEQFKNSAILKSIDGGYSWFSLAYDSQSAFLGPFKSDNDYLIIRNNDKLILSGDCFESYEEIQIPNEISSEMYFIGYGGFSGTLPINQDTLNAFEFFKYSVVENKFITGSVIYDYKIPHPLVSYIILDNNNHIFHISYKTYEIDGKEYRNIISFYHSSVDEQRYKCTAEDSSYWYSYHLFGISEEIQINVAGSRFYYSIDKGKSWNNVQYDCIDCSYPLFNTLSYYISPSRVYFVTTDGLYYLEKGQLMSVNYETSINKSEIFISPNPATDYVDVTIPPLERGLGGVAPVVRVFNVLGIEHPVSTMSFLRKPESPVKTDEIPGQAGNDSSIIRLDVSHLPPGVYFVQIGTRVQRFVKM